MHDQFGPRAHRALLDAYAQRMTTAAAIEKALQVSQADYERSYREYLARYLATQGLQVAPPPVSLAAMERAAQEENADAATKAALAKAYLDRQNFSLARRWADAAREESASLPVAAYVLARLKLSIGETEAALELLRDSLDENQPQEDALALLAALTLQAEDFGAALRLYELGQKHFPASDRWLRGMARIHLQQSDEERLAAVLERLAALEPDSIPIRKKLAALALAHQRPESARRWATELIHLDLSDPLPHAQLAQAARQLADLDLAAEEYETATVLDPQQLVWRIAWAEVLLELGQPDRAREVVESVRGRAVEQPGLKALLEKLKRE